MKAASQYETNAGSFIIEINGDYVGVNNASNPTYRSLHYDMLADINAFIRAMVSLGVAANLIYAATIKMLGAVKGVRFIEAW
jgi:hypothetical protein|nr:MAG TPA: hypothetical protein [Caudoviricetes sp.]